MLWCDAYSTYCIYIYIAQSSYSVISYHFISNARNNNHICILDHIYIYIYIHIIYLYVPDEGSLLQKYRVCTTSNDFEPYSMCCGVMLLLLILCIYIYVYGPKYICDYYFAYWI